MAPPSASQPLDFKDIIALCSAGRLAEAEAAALALVAARPRDAQALNLLGAILAQQNKAAAVGTLLQAAALNPAWDEPHANLGLFHTQQGNFPGARDALRTALKLQPGKTSTAINLGNALRELGERDEAEAVYRTALGPGPLQAMAYSNLGGLMFDREDYDRAADCYRRAIAAKPDLGPALLNLGRSLDHLQKWDEAETVLHRAIAVSPKSHEPVLALAHVLHHQDRLEEALQAYRRVFDLRPNDLEAGSNMSKLLFRLGRHAEALAAAARGPGIISLSLAPQAAPPRVIIPGGPHFIGAWKTDQPQVCDDLIAFFESRKGGHVPGRSALGVDKAVKDSMDLAVQPADINRPDHAPVKTYLRHLEACAADYARAWPVFGSMFKHVDVMAFNLQRYLPSGHFQRVHAERMSFLFIHRVMAWMTYLNDVEDGGETVFDHYGITVKPERGKTLIWPAEWTHAHHGGVVKAGVKYIITGWMHFPPPKIEDSK